MSPTCPNAQAILTRLDQLGIHYEHYTHPPVETAAHRYPMNLTFDAQVCKNLLVTTRNESRIFLLMLPIEKTADLKGLRAAMGCTRLGFASASTLLALLRQTQGSVGVCGVTFDRENRVEVVLDASLRSLPRIAMHPGDNTQTVVLSFEGIEKYVRSCGNTLTFYDFPQTGPDHPSSSAS